MSRDWFTEEIEGNGFDKKRRELSEKINVHESYIGKLENGLRNPSVRIAKKLGEVLGFDWTKFFNEAEKGA